MKNITKLHYRNKHFVIIQNDEGFYLSIEDKYIDENGCLNQTLNGIQMHAGKTLDENIQNTKTAVDTEYYMSQGFDLMDAVKMAVIGQA